MIVHASLLIARRHAPELLEPVDQPFHQTTQPIYCSVKAASSLVRLVRDRHAHAPSSQVLPDLAATVPLVAHHATWSQSRTTSASSLDRSLLHQLLEGGRLMTLAGREDKGHRLAQALSPHMHLGAEAALRATKGFTIWVAPGSPSRMLVRPNDGAIHVMDLPIEQAFCIRLLLQSVQDALPEALLAPPVEASGKRGPGAVALGDITPGSAGTVEPEQTVDRAAMANEGPAALAPFWWSFGWQERLQSLILLVSQVMSTHNLAVYRVCEQTLGSGLLYTKVNHRLAERR
jgi:hypothetical protein